jgi:hypothetical protein
MEVFLLLLSKCGNNCDAGASLFQIPRRPNYETGAGRVGSKPSTRPRMSSFTAGREGLGTGIKLPLCLLFLFALTPLVLFSQKQNIECSMELRLGLTKYKEM